jgi:hypothetical protein
MLFSLMNVQSQEHAESTFQYFGPDLFLCETEGRPVAEPSSASQPSGLETAVACLVSYSELASAGEKQLCEQSAAPTKRGICLPQPQMIVQRNGRTHYDRDESIHKPVVSAPPNVTFFECANSFFRATHSSRLPVSD